MLKKKERRGKAHFFFNLFGILHAFLWHVISSGPSLQLLDFPLSSFLPVQTCRCDINITLVGSSVIVITGTCTSHKGPSIQSERLSKSFTNAVTWINSENLMLPKVHIYLIYELIVSGCCLEVIATTKYSSLVIVYYTKRLNFLPEKQHLCSPGSQPGTSNFFISSSHLVYTMDLYLLLLFPPGFPLYLS